MPVNQKADRLTNIDNLCVLLLGSRAKLVTGVFPDPIAKSDRTN
ncbi:hypothetical protein [Aerosakkonema funiforme]